MSTGIMARLMFCQGLRTAPLCWLDIATRCKVPAICRAHDRSAEKSANHWAAKQPPRSVMLDGDELKHVAARLGKAYIDGRVAEIKVIGDDITVTVKANRWASRQ